MASDLRFEPGVLPHARPGSATSTRAQNRLARTRSICLALRDQALALGLDAVSLDVIAQQAEITKPALYRYFSKKSEIAEALFKPLLDPVEQHFSSCEQALRAATSPIDVFAAYAMLAEGLLQVITADPALIRLYLQERHGAATDMRAPVLWLGQTVRTRAIALTQLAQERGWLRPIDPVLSTTAVIGAVHELLWQHETLDFDRAAQDAISLVGLVLDGLRLPEPPTSPEAP